LYGAKVFESVVIGERCIIGGCVANWSSLGDDVTFMGGIAHSYRQPGVIVEWNTEPVASPVVGDGAIVGEGALLVGGIEIGKGSYVGAHELVKCDVPEASLYLGGKITPLRDFRGYIRSRI
jgi:acetyltransferase-like isoleucine patch superfamily enzyme